MREILKLSMSLKSNRDGLEIGFESDIVGVVLDKLNESEVEKITDLVKGVTDIIEEAIVRDMKKFAEEKVKENERTFDEKIEAIKKLRDETFEKMSKEEQEKAKEFEEKLDKIEDPKEMLGLLMKMLVDDLLDK